MAPSPLTPISEESLPNYPEIKVNKEKPVNNNATLGNNNHMKDDRGCLFFYDKPEAKGTFQEDLFFKNAQKNYEEAIEDILSRRSHEASSSGPVNNNTNNISAYRLLRSDNCRQDTQASGLTDLGHQYQIVLDVTNYSPADITVKAVGDQELLVEGRRIETRSDGTSVNQSFSRRFGLPGLVQLDAVTSALSSDGVLTVTAPKMATPNSLKVAGPASSSSTSSTSSAVRQEYVEPRFIGSRGSSDNGKMTNGIQDSVFDEKDNIYKEEFRNFLNDMDLETRMKYQMGFADGKNSMMPQETQMRNSVTSDMVEEDQHFTISLNTTGYSPKDISVKAVGERELLVEGKHIEKNENGAETNQCFSRRFCLPQLVNLEAIRSSLSPDGTLTITAPKLVVNTMPNLQNQSKHQEKQSSINTSSSRNLDSSSMFSTPRDLSASHFHDRNSFDDFFGDDFDISYRRPSLFMERAHNDYNESIKNMMNRNWVMEAEMPSFFNDTTTLLPMENNAAKASSEIIESATDYKMKLDVHRYKPEDISVKAVGDRELLIEGKHVEKKASGGPALSHSFSRRFCLPGLVQLDAITSSLAADGTLTISAPKVATH